MVEHLREKGPTMPRFDTEELAIRRQEAGLWYKVTLGLIVLAAVVGGFVSLVAFHAPAVPFKGARFLVFLIWGTPGFVPFFALYVILWYNPPRKKVQDKRPTTSGALATEAHQKSTKVTCPHCQHVQTVSISQETLSCE
jgi:hypothetical protein